MAITTVERLAQLQRLHPKLIDLSLDRIAQLMERLGNPHLRLPPVVHIAGTNGKGSTVAYLRAIYGAARLRVHSYISPHLVDFTERITLCGEQISEDYLLQLLDRAEAANQGQPITLFEITTAAAFIAFSETAADLLLLEVGLGGRLDATNLVPQPALCVITPISLDHQHYLGNSIEQIAAEKAGIIKENVPLVVGLQPDAAAAVITARAKSLGAPLYRHGIEWQFAKTASGLRFHQIRGVNRATMEPPKPQAKASFTIDSPPPSLFGEHQYGNAATAIAAAMVLSQSQEYKPLQIETAAMAKGVATASWPARMEPLKRGKLLELVAEGDELWLGGGHNIGAGEALKPSLNFWSDRPLVMIFGMLETKDPSGYLREVQPFLTRLLTITVPKEPLAVPAEKLALVARELGINAIASESFIAALKTIKSQPHPSCRILICGSLYLAGSVLAANRL